MSKSLLSINDLSKQEILDLIEFAKNFKNDDGSFKKENLFPDKTVANVLTIDARLTRNTALTNDIFLNLSDHCSNIIF